MSLENGIREFEFPQKKLYARSNVRRVAQRWVGGGGVRPGSIPQWADHSCSGRPDVGNPQGALLKINKEKKAIDLEFGHVEDTLLNELD